MNAQEQQMLQGLVERVNATPVADKDADAEQMIRQTLGKNPDALYVLAQTVLVQGYALEQAQRQSANLREHLEQARTQEPKHGGSFLGNLLGRPDVQQASASAVPPPPIQTQYPSGGYGPGLAYPSGGYPIAGAPGAGGGFLQTALRTAAGVAAGAFAFEGIESLMHGFGHSAGYGSGFGSGGGGGPEEIVNNYYGDASSGWHEAAHHASGSSNTADANGGARLQDADFRSDGGAVQDGSRTDADDLSGTTDTDYSSQGDDSMLSDNVGADTDGGDFGGGDDGVTSNF